jgi:hypothetical protein
VNPYGLEYVRWLLRALTMPRPLIAEWSPLWHRTVPLVNIAVFGTALVVFGYAFLRNGRRGLRPGITTVACLALAAVTAWRHVPIFAVAAFPFLASLLSATPLAALLESFLKRRWIASAVCAAFVAFGVVQSVLERSWELRLPESAEPERLSYPVSAVRRLADRGFEGKLVTGYDEGAYVSWMLHPLVQVSIDSRYEVAYHPGLLIEHVNFRNAGPGWREFLDKYGADAALLPCTAPVVPLLAADPLWSRTYGDRAFVLFERSSRVGLPAANPGGD